MPKYDALLRDYQWVTERIAVGSAITTRDEVDAIVSDGVTHVIDCRLTTHDRDIYTGTGIRYLHNPTPDDGKRKANEWFWRGIVFTERALATSRTKVLVHCKFGMSRGPSMTYALLRALGFEGDEAEQRIREARITARVTYREDADRAVRAWKARPETPRTPQR